MTLFYTPRTLPWTTAAEWYQIVLYFEDCPRRFGGWGGVVDLIK